MSSSMFSNTVKYATKEVGLLKKMRKEVNLKHTAWAPLLHPFILKAEFRCQPLTCVSLTPLKAQQQRGGGKERGWVDSVTDLHGDSFWDNLWLLLCLSAPSVTLTSGGFPSSVKPCGSAPGAPHTPRSLNGNRSDGRTAGASADPSV